MQLCAITDRRGYGPTESERRHGLLRQVEAWAHGGVEWVQVREKDLGAEDLTTMVRDVMGLVATAGARTRVLVNGPASVAAATGAAGVHLPTGELTALPERVRHSRAVLGGGAYVSVACHSDGEALAARDSKASVIVFAPVFEKVLASERRVLEGAGLAALREVCAAAAPVPVWALGGVTIDNAPACIAAGAAGVAGVRLFAADRWRVLGSGAK